MFIDQDGKCAVLGEKMKEKHGDSDPYNMSPERLSNKIHYTKDNVEADLSEISNWA